MRTAQPHGLQNGVDVPNSVRPGLRILVPNDGEARNLFADPPAFFRRELEGDALDPAFGARRGDHSLIGQTPLKLHIRLIIPGVRKTGDLASALEDRGARPPLGVVVPPGLPLPALVADHNPPRPTLRR